MIRSTMRWARRSALGARGQVLPMSRNHAWSRVSIAPGSSPPTCLAHTRTVTGQSLLAKQADVCNVRISHR